MEEFACRGSSLDVTYGLERLGADALEDARLVRSTREGPTDFEIKPGSDLNEQEGLRMGFGSRF